MALLEWSDALVLDVPAMDDTHEEFVELLAQVDAATDDILLHAWEVLIAHTDDHFGREDQWMRATGFSAANCHTTQHRVVLSVMREGAQQGAAGRLDVIRHMARELAAWFVQHAQSMDAGLALHLRSVGFDLATGHIGHAEALPAAPITGCGSSTCSPAAAH